MTLFSWFMKKDKKTVSKQSDFKKNLTDDSELEVILTEKSNAFNGNTMWPIAKVKTTTMIIKKPKAKEKSANTMTKSTKTSLVNIQLSH